MTGAAESFILSTHRYHELIMTLIIVNLHQLAVAQVESSIVLEVIDAGNTRKGGEGRGVVAGGATLVSDVEGMFPQVNVISRQLVVVGKQVVRHGSGARRSLVGSVGPVAPAHLQISVQVLVVM